MRAHIGDWLLVHAGTDSGTDRRGKILGVHGEDGTPPYEVHWIDTDHTALVFPGADAQVLSAGELDELDHRMQQRISSVQAEILGTHERISEHPSS